MADWKTFLFDEMGACEERFRYYKHFETAEDAWKGCRHGPDLLWVLCHTFPKREFPDKVNAVVSHLLKDKLKDFHLIPDYSPIIVRSYCGAAANASMWLLQHLHTPTTSHNLMLIWSADRIRELYPEPPTAEAILENLNKNLDM